MNDAYKQQVSLLLQILPEVAKEECFALHGGTAINLFLRNMPRLSVDIDLTYLPIEDRETSLTRIDAALENISMRLKQILPDVTLQHQKGTSKLQISYNSAQIKIEVNQIIRGTISNPKKMPLCSQAQEIFDVFCAINVVPISQLYGGKIIAALDRQHPRDLFDVKYMFDEGILNGDLKTGFIFSLLSSNRPMYEILNPNRTNQKQALDNHFQGMSSEIFSYEDFEKTRERLINYISEILNQKDKEFLISVKSLKPDWSIHDFEKFPSIQWKIENLKRLKSRNSRAYKNAVIRLTDYLN